MNQYLRKVLLCSSALLLLNGCSTINFSNKTTHQGNLSVTSSVNQLKKGMSKETVAKIMGSSLIQPLFNQNRWDYTLTTQKPNKEVKIKSVVLYFKENALNRIVKKG